jgi:Fe-Mn family superoxide dismutase
MLGFSVAALGTGRFLPSGAWGAEAPDGPFQLPELEYPFDALVPAIGPRTMEIHYSRHHQAYVNNANSALQLQPELRAMTPEQILRSIDRVTGSIRVAVRNNVGGHVNHVLYWDILTPGGAKAPPRALDNQITKDIGSFDEMIRRLASSAISRFGSGWAWLALYNGKLGVWSTANQDSPLMDGATPILGIDVWEHAYYLDYQYDRSAYVKAVLAAINWDRVNARFEAAVG